MTQDLPEMNENMRKHQYTRIGESQNETENIKMNEMDRNFMEEEEGKRGESEDEMRR